MAPTTAKSAVAGKQQTRLNFKNVRKNASGSLKQSKPSLVMAAASKATAKSKITKKQATRASDASSIELDECVQEELPEIEGMESGSESPPPTEPLPLNVKDKRYTKIYGKAKAKQNGLPIIHGENESKFITILRTFDLSCEYGPCVGVSRLERWERANAMGLEPPQEIYDILTSREGLEQEALTECVFYNHGI